MRVTFAARGADRTGKGAPARSGRTCAHGSGPQGAPTRVPVAPVSAETAAQPSRTHLPGAAGGLSRATAPVVARTSPPQGAVGIPDAEGCASRHGGPLATRASQSATALTPQHVQPPRRSRRVRPRDLGPAWTRAAPTARWAPPASGRGFSALQLWRPRPETPRS